MRRNQKIHSKAFEIIANGDENSTQLFNIFRTHWKFDVSLKRMRNNLNALCSLIKYLYLETFQSHCPFSE